MMPPWRTACRLMSTVQVTPWSVKAPFAVTVTVVPSVGRVPRSTGWIVLKMAVGNWLVSIA
jgi:hypothetical protein